MVHRVYSSRVKYDAEQELCEIIDAVWQTLSARSGRRQDIRDLRGIYKKTSATVSYIVSGDVNRACNQIYMYSWCLSQLLQHTRRDGDISFTQQIAVVTYCSLIA